MKHERVDIQKLTRRLRQAAKGKTPSQIAAAAKVDRPRVTRFLNGDFSKMTPVLRRVCGSLNIEADDYLLNSGKSNLPFNILASLRRIVGKDPTRIAAASRLIRSLETLTAGNRPPSRSKTR